MEISVEPKRPVSRIGDPGHHQRMFEFHDRMLDIRDEEPYSASNIAKSLYHAFWAYYHDALR